MKKSPTPAKLRRLPSIPELVRGDVLKWKPGLLCKVSQAKCTGIFSHETHGGMLVVWPYGDTQPQKIAPRDVLVIMRWVGAELITVTRDEKKTNEETEAAG